MRIQEFDEAWQIESFDLFEKGGTTIDDIDGEEEIAEHHQVQMAIHWPASWWRIVRLRICCSR